MNASGSRWIGLLAVGLAALAALIAAWFAWDREAVLEWKQSASPPLFFAAMSLLPALGAPLTPFYIVAGATFGLGIGGLGSAIALSLNLAICYVVAQQLPRAWLTRVLERFNLQIPDYGREPGVLRFTLLVKFTPGVPMFLKNYLLGMAGVHFGVYFGVSLLVAALYAVPLMVLGDSLFKHDWSVVLVVLAIVVAGVWIWRRQQAR